MLAETSLASFLEAEAPVHMKARTNMESSEQGKGFDLKISPFEIADEKKKN